jgi:branched-subunit amino acid ABC-type transport system permease component
VDIVFVLTWPFRFEVPIAAVILGVVVGLSYALLALGLSLIYRSSRVLNLAHGEIGALAAAVVALLVNQVGLPYWLAALAALAVAALLGALVELTVIRRLFKSPRLMLLVATLGIAQLFLFMTFFVNDQIEVANRLTGFPQPFDASVELGPLVLHAGELLILIVVPLLVIAFGAFFRYTAFGIAVRASAENADSARLVGIPTKRVSPPSCRRSPRCSWHRARGSPSPSHSVPTCSCGRWPPPCWPAW